MSCTERTQIEEFVKGKLTAQQMLEVDSHIRECADCRKLAKSLSARVELASAVTGASDCPEYEELSAYVDRSLDAARTAAVRAHANLCEYCSADLDRITELRSHAALRDTVTVMPGASRRVKRGFFGYWRQALVVTSVAGLIAAAFVFSDFGGTPTEKPTPSQTAAKPPVSSPISEPEASRTEPSPVPAPPKPSQVAAKPQPVPQKVAVKPEPAPMVTPPAVLKDGRYSVVRKDGSLVLAKTDGSSVGSGLSGRIAARIDEKLRTGRVKLPEPVRMAIATFTMRSDAEEYQPQPAAPKPVSPIGRIVMSTQPTFQWSPVDLAEAYRVQVYDESGDVVAEQITTNTSLKLSTPLTRDTAYTWRVAVRFGEMDSWTRSALSPFYVLPQQDYDYVNQVRSQLPGSHLAIGAAYESVGLYAEAANEYRILRRQNPNSKLAGDLLDGVAKH